MRQISTLIPVVFCVLLITGCAARQPPLPVTTLTPLAVESAKKEKTPYWIEVQIPQRKLVLAKGDHVVKTFPVAVGLPSYPTPIGRRTINRVVWNPWWYPPKTSKWVEDATPVPPRAAQNPLGEIKLPLGQSYLIHGTRAVESVGQWASHGCIRMLFEDVFALTQLLETQFSKSSPIADMERAGENPTKEFTTKLDRDVPVFLTYETVRIYGNYITISPDVYGREEDRVSHIAEVLKSHLKKNQKPSSRKIKNVLHLFRKSGTIHVPVESLLSS